MNCQPRAACTHHTFEMVEGKKCCNHIYIYNNPASFPEGGTVGAIYGFARDRYALLTEQLLLLILYLKFKLSNQNIVILPRDDVISHCISLLK